VKQLTKTFQYGDQEITIETGKIARQADGSVIVKSGNSVLLVSVVYDKNKKEEISFLPLSVSYVERMYSIGKIPGSFFKREGRPTDNEILISRLIDRAIRPLFPKNFSHEVQVIVTLLSYDKSLYTDILAILGTSVALLLAGIPISPVAAMRIQLNNDNEFQINPKKTINNFNLILSGTEESIMMMEFEGKEIEDKLLSDAIKFGHINMKPALIAINELIDEASSEIGKFDFSLLENNNYSDELKNEINEFISQQIISIYNSEDKKIINNEINALRNKVIDKFISETNTQKIISNIFSKINKDYIRNMILNENKRTDGRDINTIREIEINHTVLPRTHGSALFTRGNTQALVITTLGNDRDSQILDVIDGESKNKFMLHYNFPPYCVGEVGMFGLMPKRREIGHGHLAKKALNAVMPDENQFPYTIRVVSEITESDGSSSMATVCGTSIALMDAGVPITKHVAGIAMGLIKENADFIILTDIMGNEDHIGDMDLKLAGTVDGITALQMDSKITDINYDIIEKTIFQGRNAINNILGLMNTTMNKPSNLSKFAPQIHTMTIPVSKIKIVIGKGGEKIKSITTSSGATIDINDSGLIKISSDSQDSIDIAVKEINALIVETKINDIHEGVVCRLEEYGAFIKFAYNKQGLLHISQICNDRVHDIKDHLKMNDKVTVKVIGIDSKNRIQLSIKALNQK
jgi:polyribonucleotide nucleotidyltransferase